MTMHDAEVDDVYADARGKLWRVVGKWTEPVVVMKEIESCTMDGRREKITGGVSGLMWNGFIRIFRPRPLAVNVNRLSDAAKTVGQLVKESEGKYG